MADGDALSWRVKPKLHLFQDVVKYQAQTLCNPCFVWTYPDEDFVGWVAAMAGSRGGPHGPNTVAKTVMNRYRALSHMTG